MTSSSQRRLRARTLSCEMRPVDPPSWHLTPTCGKGSEGWGQLFKSRHKQVRVGETRGRQRPRQGFCPGAGNRTAL